MFQVKSRWLGLIEHDQAESVQNECAELVADSQNIVVLGCMHPPVITLGIRSSANKDVNATPEVLEEYGFKLQALRRGGSATLHSPGQLLIYPIADLNALNIGVREWVELLLKTTAATLNFFDCPTKDRGECSSSQVGVFTEQGKIAFAGLQIRRGISTHGLSVNIENDLDLFKMITPCGVVNQAMDSLKQRGISVSCEEFFKQWMSRFRTLTLPETDTKFVAVSRSETTVGL